MIGTPIPSSARRLAKGENIRMLVDKLGAVVDLIVDDDVKVLLGVVLSNILVGKLLGGHFEELRDEVVAVVFLRAVRKLS